MIPQLFSEGPLAAFLLSLALSPLAMIALTIGIEHRPWRLKDQYAAFIYGDVALAFTVAAGASAWATATLQSRSDVSTSQWAMLVIGLFTGVGQWAAEVHDGTYTRGQALSPTKIWHQIVILPLLTPAVGSSLLVLVPQWETRPATFTVGCLGVVLWVALFLHDQTHPKVAHADFSWSLSARRSRS